MIGPTEGDWGAGYEIGSGIVVGAEKPELAGLASQDWIAGLLQAVLDGVAESAGTEEGEA